MYLPAEDFLFSLCEGMAVDWPESGSVDGGGVCDVTAIVSDKTKTLFRMVVD